MSSIATLLPPAWMGISPEVYRRFLQRKAVAHRNRDRKRGGSYTVKDAVLAIHSACHASDGLDPYDGLPMDAALIGTYDNAASQAGRTAYKRGFDRLPTVDHRNGEPVCDFQIVSWQVNDAKGEMPDAEFRAFCARVAGFSC